jgi:DNA-binding LytR/AlgR family response regulator
MNCIIVADKTNCKILEEFVGRFSTLNLVGTFSNRISAINQLKNRQDIDSVFIDLDMPEGDVFNFMADLTYTPIIILVSSDDENALKAFNFKVADYLLKPVTYSRFCRAVDKAIRYYLNNETKKTEENEIFIKNGSTLVRLKFKDITYIEALENYIILNTQDERFTIHYTMKAIEDQLPSEVFIRVHRSFIVNKSMIQTIMENSLELIFGNEQKNIPIGKSFRDPLLKSIKVVLK